MNSETPTIRDFTPLEGEFAAAAATDDGGTGLSSDVVCVCGNDTTGDGFFYCTRDGQRIDFDHEGLDGLDYQTIYCPSCHRILDVVTDRARDLGHTFTPEQVAFFTRYGYGADDIEAPVVVLGHVTSADALRPAYTPRQG